MASSSYYSTNSKGEYLKKPGKPFDSGVLSPLIKIGHITRNYLRYDEYQTSIENWGYGAFKAKYGEWKGVLSTTSIDILGLKFALGVYPIRDHSKTSIFFGTDSSSLKGGGNITLDFSIYIYNMTPNREGWYRLGRSVKKFTKRENEWGFSRLEETTPDLYNILLYPELHIRIQFKVISSSLKGMCSGKCEGECGEKCRMECVVCLEDIVEIGVFSCGHVVCSDCKIGAIRSNGRCPIPHCREEQVIVLD